MKRINLKVIIVIAVALITTVMSCGDVLKKYENCTPLNSTVNKAGIKIRQIPGSTSWVIELSDNYLIYKNIDLLAKRFSLVDAANPAKQLDAFFGAGTGNIFMSIINKPAKKYALLCFQGIDKSESAELETPPCFFIISFEGTTPQVISPAPLLAENLFPVDYEKGQFDNKPYVAPAPVVEAIPITTRTEYMDNIALGNGKSLSVSFVLASKEDEKVIEKCEIAISTTTRNADGSTRTTENKYNGYDINVADNGKFSQKISDFTVKGTINNNRITGTVEMNGRKYSYSAKVENTSGNNTGIYKSMESSNIVNTTISKPFR